MEIAKERVRNWKSGLLDLSRLRLTELPELPEGVTWLHCYHNKLTSLPDTLPASLICLDCSHNQVTTLPDTLPVGLRYLKCIDNRLTRLPDILPAGLRILSCKDNKLPFRENDETMRKYLARIRAIAEAASKERIVQRCAFYFEELAKKVWHPQRVERLMLAGVDMENM
jgi:hypothetical protein